MSRINVLTGEKGFNQFADMLNLSKEEKEQRRRLLQDSFMPFKVTEYYAKRIASLQEPYRTQMANIVLPPPGPKKFEGRFDPYGNKTYRDGSKTFLQHKYEKTLLLHIDDFCISNCQFCYKVHEIRHETTKSAGLDEKVSTALEYLDAHQEIDNVLFTGGDPAAFRKTLDLKRLIGRLISHKNIRIVRFATKGLAYDPERFLDGELLCFFKEINGTERKQVSIIAQINHPAELNETSNEAIKELQNVGVQIRGQPAIIRGVNDSVETLIDLQRRFVDNKIVSYYLTVFMPVKGVEQYGLPLDEAFMNVAESKRHLSGLEKKGILLTAHNFGKLEICGFFPSPEKPEKIILKWHQAARESYLPTKLKERVPTRPEDIMILNYDKGSMYCADHVFARNELPYINSEGQIVE